MGYGGMGALRLVGVTSMTLLSRVGPRESLMSASLEEMACRRGGGVLPGLGAEEGEGTEGDRPGLPRHYLGVTSQGAGGG